MVQYGPWILSGILTMFAIAIFVLIGAMVKSSMDEKKARAAAAPKEGTLADQIVKQFQEEDARKERVLYTKSGLSSTGLKETQSFFAFAEDDEEKAITLDSDYDNGLEESPLDPDDKF